jgi:precorrin-6Y C5,15-methyltransferase (decarboxylating)
MSVLEHMGGPAEKIHHGVASDFRGKTFRDLNTIALQCPAETTSALFSRIPGLPDEAFDHDGQITKQEIRAATLAALAPCPGELLWDVGAGSGSVGIEWMRSHPANRAIAIEPRKDRQALIEINCRKLGVPQLRLVKGSALDSLKDLNTPDAIFIGGGLSVDGIFETCWSSLKQRGRLVSNAVTIEGEQRLFDLHNRFGGTLTRHNISRAEKIGGFTSWKPFRQVTQIRLVKE